MIAPTAPLATGLADDEITALEPLGQHSDVIGASWKLTPHGTATLNRLRYAGLVCLARGHGEVAAWVLTPLGASALRRFQDR